jgi:hypothetical protein
MANLVIEGENARMSMIELPEVTLCAVDTRHPELAVRALKASLQGLNFGRTLMLTDPVNARTLDLPPGIELGVIQGIGTTAEYSDFMLRRLLGWVDTRHVLVVQWDGFVIDASRWESSFLDFDYLGAPWRKALHGHAVGNGGFSLRSRRLLQALQDPAVADRLHHPEDICIGQTLRPWLESHDIVFGSTCVARRFAFEHEEPATGCFGFHGMINLPRAIGLQAFSALMADLPPALTAGRDGFKTARALLSQDRPDLALKLLEKSAQVSAPDARRRWLAGCCRLGLWLGRGTSAGATP